MNIAALQDTLRRFAGELLQLADQTAIALDDGPGAKTYVLIDWENVQPGEDDCRQLVPEATDVWLFRGRTQKGAVGQYASFGDRAVEVPVMRPGKNALDFHLSFYMGYIASKQPEARFVVISNDKGYGPMLAHAQDLGFAVSHAGFRAPRARKATPRKAAAKKVPAKKAAVAKAVAPKKAPVARKTAAVVAKAPKTKNVEQVLAILRKQPVASRSSRLARLRSQVAQLMGGDKAAAESTIERLAADGHLSIDAKGAVAYRL